MSSFSLEMRLGLCLKRPYALTKNATALNKKTAGGIRLKNGGIKEKVRYLLYSKSNMRVSDQQSSARFRPFRLK